MRKLLTAALLLWVAPAQGDDLVLDYEREMLPGHYRCLPLAGESAERDGTGLQPFVPNGWELSLHGVVTEETLHGLMVEVDRTLSERLRLRVGGGTMRLQRESRIGDLHFEESLQLPQMGAYLEWGGLPLGLSLVGGVVWNDTRDELSAYPEPGLIYNINDRLYTSEEIGTLEGTLEYAPLIPYLGVAWRRPLGVTSRWRFVADVGTIFNMKPKLTLRSDAATEGINADIAAESHSLEDNFADRFIIATVGLSYAF